MSNLKDILKSKKNKVVEITATMKRSNRDFSRKGKVMRFYEMPSDKVEHVALIGTTGVIYNFSLESVKRVKARGKIIFEKK